MHNTCGKVTAKKAKTSKPSSGAGSRKVDNIETTLPRQLTEAEKTPVIGKMKDLNSSNAIKEGDFRVADYLPDKGNPKDN